jgi:hypothetical protein
VEGPHDEKIYDGGVLNAILIIFILIFIPSPRLSFIAGRAS